MALRFMDGFDHYASADVLAKWATRVGTLQSIGTSYGRNGTNGCQIGTSGSQNQGVIQVFDAQTTWIVGGAFQYVSSATSNYIYEFRDGSNSQVSLRYSAAGNLQVYCGSTLLATDTMFLQAGYWYYVEFKATINGTTGSYEVRVDENTRLSASNVDTYNTGNVSADRVVVGTVAGSNGAQNWDDIYIGDGTGGFTFLGDIRVETILPNANGNSSVLVGSDGNSTDNYLLVDEAAPSTSDYVESSTPGDKDTYGYANLATTSGTVAGVQIMPYAAKTDAGARSIVSVARLSGTETDGSAKSLSTSYGYHWDVRETKPGGGAWSISDVNSAEFGVKVNA